MDLLLLLIQCLLVILLIVIPLMSGFDKWRKWPTSRKIVAVALGAGIAIVAFTQYKRIIFLHKADIPSAFGGFSNARNAPWYEQKVAIYPIEYLISVGAGCAILALAIQACKRRKYARCLGFGMLFVALFAVSLSVKLQLWH